MTTWVRTVVLAGTAAASAIVATSASATSDAGGTRAVLGVAAKLAHVVGVPDPHEPSGEAPPIAGALPGYTQSYVEDFTGRALPTGWGRFAGPSSGNPSSYWAPSHVLLGGGMVRLVTYRDPRHHNRWVSGGICRCGTSDKYGAFFIRSRVTGPGPDEDELLWPVANVWPPEVDFNESAFSTHSTSWTVHYGTGSSFVQGTRTFNLTRWHTWGVIWTPTSLVFTIDGSIWGAITKTSEVPQQPMTLDIDQEARCVPGLSWAACPVRKVALQLDWVAEFAKG